MKEIFREYAEEGEDDSISEAWVSKTGFVRLCNDYSLFSEETQ